MNSRLTTAKVETLICRALVKYHWTFFLLSIVFFALTAPGLQRLTIDTDPSLYFSQKNIFYRQFQSLQDEYGKASTITFVMELKEGDFFTPDNLALIEEFTEKASDLPFTEQVNSLSNYTYSWSLDDEVYVDRLVSNARLLSDEEAKKIKSISLSDQAIVNRLISTNGQATMIGLMAYLPEDNHTKNTLYLAEQAQALAARFEQEYPHIDVLLTGDIINNATIHQAIFDDAARIMPILCLITFVLLVLFLNSFVSVIIIAILAMATCLCAIGLASASGIVLTMLSITSINIIIVIAIAHCVHILYCFLNAYRQGKEKAEALYETLRMNLVPVFLTSITTVFGFASLNFSDMPPARDFGNITVTGATIIFLFSLTILPTLIMVCSFSRESRRNILLDWIDMRKLSAFIISHHRLIALLSISFALSMLAISTQNILNSRFTENIRKPHPFRVDNEKIDAYFGGFYSIEYSFHAKENSTISSLEYLQSLDNITQWLRQQPEVRNVFSYTDVIKRLNKNMHGDQPAFYRIPASQEEAAQYLLLMEMSQNNSNGMNYYVLPDHSATKLIVALPTLDSAAMIQLHKKFDAHIHKTMPDYMYYQGTSISTIWAHMGNEVAKSSIESAATSLLLIFAVITLIFRSLKYGIASLIPNVLPMGIGYGIWAIYNGNLDMNQLTVFSITLGIVVDDTIHLLSKYLRARRVHGFSSEQAVHYSLEHVGQPLWITTAVLVTGFGLLMFSSFTPNFNLGFLAAIILLAGLVLDYLLLPSLLLIMDKTKPESAKMS